MTRQTSYFFNSPVRNGFVHCTGKKKYTVSVMLPIVFPTIAKEISN